MFFNLQFSIRYIISFFLQFVKFANIDEDTPSYHRRYEFFISRFSQLCYGANDDLDYEKRFLRNIKNFIKSFIKKSQ